MDNSMNFIRRYDENMNLVIFANPQEIHDCFLAYEARKKEARAERSRKFIAATQGIIPSAPITREKALVVVPEAAKGVLYRDFKDMAHALAAGRVYP